MLAQMKRPGSKKRFRAQASAKSGHYNSLCCETLEVFYRDFLADRLSYLPHFVNVVHGIHLLNVLGIRGPTPRRSRPVFDSSALYRK